MGCAPANTMLQSVRKAIRKQGSYIARSGDTRQHHQAIIKSLRLAEALLVNGFDLDRVRLAIEAAGGGRANALVPVTDQHIASHVFHAPTIACGADECPETKRIAQ